MDTIINVIIIYTCINNYKNEYIWIILYNEISNLTLITL